MRDCWRESELNGTVSETADTSTLTLLKFRSAGTEARMTALSVRSHQGLAALSWPWELSHHTSLPW